MPTAHVCAARGARSTAKSAQCTRVLRCVRKPAAAAAKRAFRSSCRKVSISGSASCWSQRQRAEDEARVSSRRSLARWTKGGRSERRLHLAGCAVAAQSSTRLTRHSERSIDVKERDHLGRARHLARTGGEQARLTGRRRPLWLGLAAAPDWSAGPVVRAYRRSGASEARNLVGNNGRGVT